MKDKKDKISITHLFARIVSSPDKFGGAPFINRTGVKIDSVLSLLQQGIPENEIRGRLHINKDDVALCRAWQIRFRPETLAPRFAHIAASEPFFMLDENAPPVILFDLARVFGRATHAKMEGLYGRNRNDDRRQVWPHAVENGYKAFLTADSDFRTIMRDYRGFLIEEYGAVKNSPHPVPVVIFFNNQDQPSVVRSQLLRHQADIRQFTQDNDALWADVSVYGFRKGPPDRGLKAG